MSRENFSVEDLDVNNILLGEEKKQELEPTQREIFLNKMIEEIFSTKDIELKTELSDKQILVFSRAEMYAKVFNQPILNEFTGSIMRKSLSKGRKSRGEFVNMTKGGMGALEEPLNMSSFSNRFLGV